MEGVWKILKGRLGNGEEEKEESIAVNEELQDNGKNEWWGTKK